MRKSPNTIASEVADRLEREYQEHLEYQKKTKRMVWSNGNKPKTR